MNLKDKEIRKRTKEELYKAMETGDIDVAQAVKMVRIICGLNQDEFAKKVGVTRKTISLIETGKGNPGIQVLKKILKPMKLKISVVSE